MPVHRTLLNRLLSSRFLGLPYCTKSPCFVQFVFICLLCPPPPPRPHPSSPAPMLQEEAPEIAQCARLWNRVKGAEGRWSKDWSLTALASVQRVELSLAAFADRMCGQVQVCVPVQAGRIQ